MEKTQETNIKNRCTELGLNSVFKNIVYNSEWGGLDCSKEFNSEEKQNINEMLVLVNW